MTARPRPSRPSCLLVVAAAGYGKTHEIELAAVDVDTRLAHAPKMVAGPAGLAARLAEGVSHLLVDDVDRVGQAEQSAIAQACGALPATVSLTFASRTPLDDVLRQSLGRAVVEMGAPDLALGFAGVSAVLRDSYEVDDPDRASTVHRLTGGWPELVHRAAEVLQDDPDADILAALASPGAPTRAWLDDNVLGLLPRPLAALVPLLSHCGSVSGTLLDELRSCTGSARALAVLYRLGIVVAARGVADAGWFELVPVVAEAVRRSGVAVPADVLKRAAAWQESHGHLLTAAQVLERAGDLDACRRLVRLHGDDLLAAGGAAIVRTWSDGDDEQSRILAGDAARMAGDLVAAQRTFAPVVAAYPEGGLPDAVAWRVASVAYLAADYSAARDLCTTQAEPGHGPVPHGGGLDRVRRLACGSSAAFMLGDTVACRRDADAALELAELIDCDRALAFAHLAHALLRNGARRDDHLSAALAAAQRAGDVVSASRALLNQSDSLLRSGDFRSALAFGQQALEAAELASPPGIVLYALNNVGEALLWLGRLDEARTYFARAVAVSRRLGLGRTVTALWGLAEVERHAGRHEQADISYREVIDLARDTGEAQVLVPALAGLARVLASTRRSVEGTAGAEASALADEALTLAPPELRPTALLAAGWAAWSGGEHDRARQMADDAMSWGRRLRSTVDCAGALDLLSMTDRDLVAARRASVDAERLWRSTGATAAAARSVIIRGGLADASQLDRAAGADAARRLASVGVAPWRPGQPAARTPVPNVEINVLGRFEVLVDGEPVPVAAWRSRQARSLVKILTARRGRAITRPAVCELLWPDDDPAKTPHRLSVLLSAVRKALDPRRAHDADHYIAADLVGIRLDIRHVTVDAERFLTDAAEAVATARSADVDAACSMLARLEERCRGEAFEDDPYDEWADGLREETRAAWLGVLRLEARLNAERDDVDGAVTCLVRLLSVDPFDDASYRSLVGLLSRAGRRGEARRMHERWCSAMASIDAPPPRPLGASSAAAR